MNDAQKERLIKLIEECGEVIQIASKTLQYGFNERYKDNSDNRERLEKEIADVLFWVLMLNEYDDIKLNNIDDYLVSEEIYKRKMEYSQYQPESTWK